jgi:hypothetical protein
MMPRQISCTPLTKQIMHVMLAQPATALPAIAVMSAHSTPMKLMSATAAPKPVIIRSGFTDGYYKGRTGPEMFGTRPENAPEPKELFARAKAGYSREDSRRV